MENVIYDNVKYIFQNVWMILISISITMLRAQHLIEQLKLLKNVQIYVGLSQSVSPSIMIVMSHHIGIHTVGSIITLTLK